MISYSNGFAGQRLPRLLRVGVSILPRLMGRDSLRLVFNDDARPSFAFFTACRKSVGGQLPFGTNHAFNSPRKHRAGNDSTVFRETQAFANVRSSNRTISESWTLSKRPSKVFSFYRRRSNPFEKRCNVSSRCSVESSQLDEEGFVECPPGIVSIRG